MNPALIVVRAGPDSLHRNWVAEGGKQFDVLASFYFTPQDMQGDNGADYTHVWPGSCWTGNARVCQDMWDTIKKYEHVAFCDDDVDATTSTWNRFFQICRDQSLDLASPSFNGFTTPDLSPRPGLLLRYTNVLELICPVFSQKVLPTVSKTFGENGSGWGQSSLWSSLCPFTRYPTAIVDATPMTHTREFGGGDIYNNLQAEGKTAMQEMTELYQKYRIPRVRRQFFRSIPLTPR